MSNIAVNEIIKCGKAQGACALLKERMHLHALVKLLFTPQGIEFCQKNRFPYHEQLEALTREEPELHKRNIFVDYGTIRTERRNVFASGQTELECICRYPKYSYNIILAHGACAIIRATEYAVVNVYTIGDGCSYEIENDGTAIIFEHNA